MAESPERFAARMADKVRAREKDLVEQARRALELTLSEGGVMLQDLLEAEETTTGRERVARGGGSAGRHDTGNMIASVAYSRDLFVRGDKMVGSFGWFRDTYEEYFRAQDLGYGQIPAANAMNRAALYAEERFKQRMQDIVDGRGGGE